MSFRQESSELPVHPSGFMRPAGARFPEDEQAPMPNGMREAAFDAENSVLLDGSIDALRWQDSENEGIAPMRGDER